MNNIITSFVLFITVYATAQDYFKVEQTVKNYSSHFESIEKLAKQIDTDFKTPKEKIRALYYWIATNIDYDVKNDIFDISENTIVYINSRDKARCEKIRQKKRLIETLSTNKAVCIDYSKLFKAVCNNIGIESEIVTGYSKVFIEDIAHERSYKDHAWNVVKVDNSWKLIDITWASVYMKNLSTNIEIELSDYYYFTEPKEFISTHFPIQKKWQLLTTKLSKKEFFNAPIFYPNYFKSEIKLTHPKDGIILVHKNKIKILFENIPKNKIFSYSFQRGNSAKPLAIKHYNNGKFVASIKFHNESSKLTIYANYLPVLGFKVNYLQR